MSRCLRCGADSAWLEGDVPKKPRDEEIADLCDRLAKAEAESRDRDVILQRRDDEIRFLRGEKPLRVRALEAENRTLRVLLFQTHGCIGMYGDDGEMQCSTCRIDFRLDTPEWIDAMLVERGRRRLSEPTPTVEPRKCSNPYQHPPEDVCWLCPDYLPAPVPAVHSAEPPEPETGR